MEAGVNGHHFHPVARLVKVEVRSEPEVAQNQAPHMVVTSVKAVPPWLDAATMTYLVWQLFMVPGESGPHGQHAPPTVAQE